MHEQLHLNEGKLNHLSTAKIVFALVQILICPGDDLAVIFAQTFNTVTNHDLPVAAIIHKEPKVETVFELKI